jgi:pimeloyl-ACP methyl ester carboxylesterase
MQLMKPAFLAVALATAWLTPASGCPGPGECPPVTVTIRPLDPLLPRMKLHPPAATAPDPRALVWRATQSASSAEDDPEAPVQDRLIPPQDPKPVQDRQRHQPEGLVQTETIKVKPSDWLKSLQLVPGPFRSPLPPDVVAAANATHSDAPFSAAELLTGKSIAASDCKTLRAAVWVVVDGRGECIRFYHSTAGGTGNEALVFLHADAIETNGRGEMKASDNYAKMTPDSLQNISASASRSLQMPYIVLARPGTYGSSGTHRQRRTQREIDVVSAALDTIKAEHGYERLHLVGFAGGGHTAAALLAQRTDVRCAVLTSAVVSVRTILAEMGRTEDVTGDKNPVDPIALVGKISKRSDLRIFVVTDPDDFVISARSQTHYFRKLAAAGLSANQVFVQAPDTFAHDLPRAGLMIAARCARGASADAIIAAHQNKLPATPPDADDPPLHSERTLRAPVIINEASCGALPKTVFARVEGRDFCVRYWFSNAGGTKGEMLVFIHGDLGEKGRTGLSRAAALMTSGGVQRGAHVWSRVYGGPYLAIGRLGAFGSSGTHQDRRRLIEIKVIMAALDVLKAEYAITRFHLVGQSGGGHTVAGLLQMRKDIGCAVMTSGVISHKTVRREQGLSVTARTPEFYDPIDHVGAMRDRPGQRIVVMSDRDDRIVSFHSQREFVQRVRSAGLPILHISAAAGDSYHHGLEAQGLRLASDCAKGVDDQTLISRFQTKPVSAATVSQSP